MRLRLLLDDYGLLGTLDREHVYRSMLEALAAIEASSGDESTTDGRSGGDGSQGWRGLEQCASSARQPTRTVSQEAASVHSRSSQLLRRRRRE